MPPPYPPFGNAPQYSYYPMDNSLNPSRRPSYAIAAGGGSDSQNQNSHAFNSLAGARGSSGIANTRQSRSDAATAGIASSPSRNMDVDGTGRYNTGHRGLGAGAGATSAGAGAVSFNNSVRGDFVKGSTVDSDVTGWMRSLDRPEFFTPAYLRHSRHVQKLKRQWEKQTAEYEERVKSQGPYSPTQHALATRPSSSSLNKMYTSAAGHVHRGVAQDVIERMPPPGPPDDDRLRPLPSRWSDEDKMAGLEILADGTEVRFNGVIKTSDEAAAVRADQPMPRECGIYYYEVTVHSRGKDGLIGIGFSSKKVNLARLPGWEPESWAYHGDDGYSFACTASGKNYGPRFSSMDVIGCGINFRKGTAFFTKNGVFLGNAFSGIKNEKLFPSVGMKKPGEHLKVNFGKTPFVYDITSMMQMERQTIFEDIAKQDISSLQPPASHSGGSETTLVRKLVAQYLAHEGYVETSKAFQAETEESERPLRRADGTSEELEALKGQQDDDANAINRQKIRRAILHGDIDLALNYMNSYYPTVLQDERNRDVYFRLRCRKFIEMMKRYSDLENAAKPAAVKSSNGFASGKNKHAAPDTQMELDEQLYRETSAGGPTASSKQPFKTLAPARYSTDNDDNEDEEDASTNDNDDDDDDDVDMDSSTNNNNNKNNASVSTSVHLKQDALVQDALEYGSSLSAEFQKDPRQEIHKQLNDIFAVMAYPDPKDSVVGQQLDPKGRSDIAEEVNGAILVSLGKPSSAAIEKVGAWTEALLDEVAIKNGSAAAFVSVQNDFLRPDEGGDDGALDGY
ncbi:SPRY-domain-containing protein [Polychaeton citri CBS 116435]|uniref:SPRY-domain-containing protein n=1 Tax=Polychaeton citri CBS 116435 TaxID=1314669 RepID=A0A9P4QAJ4_9PEZI|nr:SPRY-domain-containing protein [Polychaeton citri CBS 116435]